MNSDCKERCPNCGQEIPEKPALPPAYRIRGLLHCGRQVFRVDGHLGIWCTKKNPGEIGTVSLECYLPDRAGRGYPRSHRTRTLYLLPDVTAAVEKAAGGEK